MAISVMETKMGLTIVSSYGSSNTLRIVRQNPAFHSCKAILAKGLPAAQAWHEISELVSNPWKSFYDWFAGFGYSALVEDGFLKIANLSALSLEKWKPHLDKVRATAGSPEPSLQLAKSIENTLDTESMRNLCIHWQVGPAGPTPRFVQKRLLPEKARLGDLVNDTSSGYWPFLVSYDHCSVSNGKLHLSGGVVFRKLDREDDGSIFMSEPVILGNNRTYRCEEGDPSGWLEDLSFDSLAQARANLKEITQSGSEGRIINRISGLVVA